MLIILRLLRLLFIIAFIDCFSYYATRLLRHA